MKGKEEVIFTILFVLFYSYYVFHHDVLIRNPNALFVCVLLYIIALSLIVITNISSKNSLIKKLNKIPSLYKLFGILAIVSYIFESFFSELFMISEISMFMLLCSAWWYWLHEEE